MRDQLFTIGYQGRDLAEFIGLLRDAGVHLLADVRLTPLSRKRGFSKSKLSEALQQAGIRYEHLRELGNPKAIREAARSVEDCLDLYADHMNGEWPDRLARLEALAAGQRVAIMCMESDHRECHRSIVAGAFESRHDAAIVHL